MNQPTMDQFNQLQHTVFELSAKVEHLNQNEKRHDFTIRDSAVKVGIAEGLAETNFKEISQLRLQMHQIQAEMKGMRISTDEQFKGVHEKLDKQSELLREILAKMR